MEISERIEAKPNNLTPLMDVQWSLKSRLYIATKVRSKPRRVKNHSNFDTGFRNLNQSQLLEDLLFYPDSLDSQQWLVYFISRPLIGSYESTKTVPVPISGLHGNFTTNGTSSARSVSRSSSNADKKDVRSFNDLLNQFPLIARQMHLGLEKVFKEFHKEMKDRQLSLRSRRSSNTSQRSHRSHRSASVGSVQLRSNGSVHSRHSNGHADLPSLSTLRVGEEEDHLRGNLETAVTTAIDLFQQVDKQQLSVLGATTELTGPAVERLIERYVTEQLHDSVLFPFLRNSRKLEDLELESRIRGMQYIDIAQVGIEIEGGRAGKRQIMERITKGVEEFRRLGVAGSPQQMMDILLATQKTVSTEQKTGDDLRRQLADAQSSGPAEKHFPPIMINADTLVSLLLVVVVRSQVRNLNARLSYMRNFIFIDDVEGGEMGYALSTFEAVLSYLGTDSAGLRRASRRNKNLWEATKRGDIEEIKMIMESPLLQLDGVAETSSASNEQAIDDEDLEKEHESGPDSPKDLGNRTSWSSKIPTEDGYTSEGSTLAHVFPFQAVGTGRKSKRVSMDLRSLSTASEHSFISRTTTLESKFSGIEGDTSIETLAQTQDTDGNSILMMAVEGSQSEALRYLIHLKTYFPTEFLLEDCDKEGTTLLSAAVQSAHEPLIEIILFSIFDAPKKQDILDYFARPDTRGRTVAHYLFNAPQLIPKFWDCFPWRLKDKNGQTPLFALCRSYDHPEYSDMINEALEYATREQEDGKPLDLDHHIDTKGNTLLHVVSDPTTAVRILRHCDTDANATNDKLFTPLMVASKYGRMDMVRALFGDERVDVMAREARGMTAVELAKDDEIRNRIDDMVLVSNVPAADGRVTAVVRSFFVDDASVRMIIKSAVRNDNGMIGVTTCRRSLTDFENLAKWLAVEHPASWLPSIFNFRSPFQLPSRPSRAVLRDMQVRLDNFLKIMLAHSTFSTHELLWEFILFPEIQPDMMAERSRKKAEIHIENIREDYEPVVDARDVSLFVEHARESIRSVNHSTKSVVRRVSSYRVGLGG